MMAKEKGEMAIECAEAYFYYGKALLELSRYGEFSVFDVT